MLDGYGMNEGNLKEALRMSEGEDKELTRLERAATFNCPGFRMCYRNHRIKDPCSWCSRILEFLRGLE